MISSTTPSGAAPADAIDLESELQQAIADFERGDCIALTPEQLERCVADGEWPWPDESLD